METKYKKYDNFLRQSHNEKVSEMKTKCELMDKERENIWRNRTKNANEMKTYLKTLEMKNNYKADSRNNDNTEKFALREKETYDLDLLLLKQREMHKKEDDEMSEMSRNHDNKLTQEKDDLLETIKRQTQKHRLETEELEMTRKKLNEKHLKETEEIYELEIMFAEKKEKEKSNMDLEITKNKLKWNKENKDLKNLLTSYSQKKEYEEIKRMVAKNKAKKFQRKRRS